MTKQCNPKDFLMPVIQQTIPLRSEGNRLTSVNKNRRLELNSLWNNDFMNQYLTCCLSYITTKSRYLAAKKSFCPLRHFNSLYVPELGAKPMGLQNIHATYRKRLVCQV